MRQLLFAANWKMHVGPDEARAYFKAFRSRYPRHEGRDAWFFPPAISLEAAAQSARERADLLVGIQDIYWEPKGAFTGEVSAPLAVQAGARAALIGHSERRHIFGETDEDTRKKVAAAQAAGLAVVLCVGETLGEREAGHTLAVVNRQLTGALSGLDPAALDRVTIAYEPVWAIGTGRTATPAQAQEAHAFLRGLVKEIAGQEAAAGIRILYGGSVKPDNMVALMAQPDVDGGLVGGASLDASSFARIVKFRG